MQNDLRLVYHLCLVAQYCYLVQNAGMLVEPAKCWYKAIEVVEEFLDYELVRFRPHRSGYRQIVAIDSEV